jgi:hypothetical protein
MRSKTSAALMLATLLAACASPPRYRDRDPGLVMLEVVNTTPERLASVSAYDDDYDCYAGQGPLAGPIAKVDRFSTTLHRRPYQTVAFFYGATGSDWSYLSCGGIWTFRADEAGNYRLQATNLPAQRTCRIEVARQVEAGGEWVPVDMVKRELTQPLVDPAGPWCKADARFAGSSRLETPRGP